MIKWIISKASFRLYCENSFALSAMRYGGNPPHAPDEGEAKKARVLSSLSLLGSKAGALSLHRPPLAFFGANTLHTGQVVILLTT